MKIKAPSFLKLYSLMIVMIFLISTIGCFSTDKVNLGMKREKVIQKLGEPDEKYVLESKLLRKVKKDKNNFNLNYLQMVYSYEKSGIQVWFLKGKVTDVTKNGVPVF